MDSSPTSPDVPPLAASPRIRRRVLPPEELARAVVAGGPLTDLGADPERLKSMAVAVVEVDEVIVAYWVCWYALHLEPLWIREDYRKHPGVATGLIDQVREVVDASHEPAAFAVIEGENLEAVGAYAARLGFQEAPGKLYYLVLAPVAEPEKG